MGNLGTVRFIDLRLGSESSTLSTNSIPLTDGISSFQLQVRNAALCIDEAKTATGFSGEEDVDFEKVTQFNLE